MLRMPVLLALFLALVISSTATAAVGLAGDHLVVMTSPDGPELGTGPFAAPGAVTGIAALDALCRQAGVVACEPYYPGTLRRPGLARLADRLRVLRLAPSTDAAALAARVAAVPGVASAEKPSRPRLLYTPDDPAYGQQWYLPFVGAPAAWDVIRGDASSAAVVAVCDAGLLLSDPDLAPSLWINTPEDLNGNSRFDASDLDGIDQDGNGFADDVVGYDFASYDPDPGGTLGHGDGVAACISEATDNGIAGAGLGFGVRLMVVKGLTDGAMLGDAYVGMLYAADNGAGVINCSWGIPVHHDYEQAIVDAVWAEDVAIVAAGGEQDQLTYPAAYDHVYGVSSTDQTDHLAPFGPWGDTIDICAPGVNILTLWNGSLSFVSGTSFATGVVSGLAGLLRALQPQASAANILQTISDTAAPVSSSHPVGAGRIDAAAAVGALVTAVDDPPRPPAVRLQVAPTPFNAATVCSYTVAQRGAVTLTVHDARGRLVATLVRSTVNAGEHSATWKADAEPSGLYFLRLVTPRGTAVEEAMLVK